MSVNYAAGLSNFPHIHKGKCGLKEIFDSPDVLKDRIGELVNLIKTSKYLVVHTGAGISTAAGIPDFRGPNGVWTLEAKGEAPVVNIDFDEAVPTRTHMAILALQQHGIVKYVVSQNIDGLHIRSGYPRSQLSELHGNMFVEKCEKCAHEYFRRTPVSTMTQKRTGNVCTRRGRRGLSNCRGRLRDTILDWEDSLPTKDLDNGEIESKKADISLCLGTTLQIVPSGKLPLLTLKNQGKLVIVNLQPTKYFFRGKERDVFGWRVVKCKRMSDSSDVPVRMSDSSDAPDKKANILIHGYVDDVMQGVMDGLGLSAPAFDLQFYLSLIDPLPDDKIKTLKNDDIKEEPVSNLEDGKEVQTERHTDVKFEGTNDAKTNDDAKTLHLKHKLESEECDDLKRPRTSL